MKGVVIAISFLFAGIGLGSFIGSSHPKPLPLHAFKIERRAYELAYDGERKQAKWVYERLTADNIQGNTNRKNFDFHEDPLGVNKSVEAEEFS